MPDAWQKILTEWGFPVLFLFVVATNLDKIGKFGSRVLAILSPAYEARLRHKQELERLERERQDKERDDTIAVFRELMMEQRQRLQDADLSIKAERNRVYDLVIGNERMNAQTVEVMRDVSAAIRASTDRVNGLSKNIVTLTTIVEKLSEHIIRGEK